MKIHLLRGRRVMLDQDLADICGVSTKRLNQPTLRNISRFPADFMSRLDVAEWKNLRLLFATSSSGYGGRRRNQALDACDRVVYTTE